jgi:hypothetical protein
MLYDSASNQRLPCFYICQVAHVLGRAPLILCFISGNSHPIIPYHFKDNQRIGHASADTQQDQGNLSRLSELNLWNWRYGRGSPWMMSMNKEERIRAERLSKSRIRAADARKRRSEATAAAGAAQGGSGSN